MMFDRIYGRIELPESARRLARTCPLLLRLREVRMPNIPFYDFPSFANVSRYEHSVGVAHLAYWWAKRNSLDDESVEAVTLAALYHDAATPAFSHLFEEFLSRQGFDHEIALADILSARPAVDGGRFAQVFLGRHCRLRDEIGLRARADSVLSATGIAGLVTARHPLGVAVHGDLDLDNIDNVIRAVTAMGLARDRECIHPYEVASCLAWDGTRVGLVDGSPGAVGRWRALRRRLYGSILRNEREFLAQATIKWALEECYKADPALSEESAWTLTESELIFQHLRQTAASRRLIDAVRLGQPAQLLLSAWLDDVSSLAGDDSDKVTRLLCEQLGEIFGCEVYLNFYIDKRERSIRLPKLESGTLFDSLFASPQDESDPVASNDLPANTVTGSRSGARGLVGVVGFSGSKSSRAHKDALLERAAEVFVEVLAQGPVSIDTCWLGDVASAAAERWMGR
jgi:hypothetical protein